MLALAFTLTSAWLGGRPATPAPRGRAVHLSAIEFTQPCFDAQKEKFFELMPSEKLPSVSLDLRAFASKASIAIDTDAWARG